MKLSLGEERVAVLLEETIVRQCLADFCFSASLKVRGLLVVTVDENEACIVDVNKTMAKFKTTAAENKSNSPTKTKRKLPRITIVPAKKSKQDEHGIYDVSDSSSSLKNGQSKKSNSKRSENSPFGKVVTIAPSQPSENNDSSSKHRHILPKRTDFYSENSIRIIPIKPVVKSEDATVAEVYNQEREESDASNYDHMYAAAEEEEEVEQEQSAAAAEWRTPVKKPPRRRGEEEQSDVDERPPTPESNPKPRRQKLHEVERLTYPSDDEYRGKTPIRQLVARGWSNSRRIVYTEKQMWDCCCYVVNEGRPTRHAARRFNIPRSTIVAFISRLRRITDDVESVFADINGPPVSLACTDPSSVWVQKSIEKIARLQHSNIPLWEALRSCVSGAMSTRQAAHAHGVQRVSLMRYLSLIRTNADVFDPETIEALVGLERSATDVSVEQADDEDISEHGNSPDISPTFAIETSPVPSGAENTDELSSPRKKSKISVRPVSQSKVPSSNKPRKAVPAVKTIYVYAKGNMLSKKSNITVNNSELSEQDDRNSEQDGENVNQDMTHSENEEIEKSEMNNVDTGEEIEDSEENVVEGNDTGCHRDNGHQLHKIQLVSPNQDGEN